MVGLTSSLGTGRPTAASTSVCSLCSRTILSWISWRSMRTLKQLPLFLLQHVPNLLVGHLLVDQLSNALPHDVGRAAGIHVAAGQGVEVAGANVTADSTGAVGAGQEPLDALLLRPRAV